MRIRAWLWAIAMAAMAAFSTYHLVRGEAIQTDLLDMLPATERNPVAEQAIRALAKNVGERAVLLLKAENPEQSKQAALKLAEAMRQTQVFADVTATLPPMDPAQVARFYEPFAPRVAPPPAHLEPTREGLRQHLEGRLASPHGSFSGLGAAADPLGHLEDFLGRLPLMASNLRVEDGLLVISAEDGLHVMVTAGLKGSAFDPEIQQRSIDAARQAERQTLALYPKLEILRTGVLFYAADAKESAERETNLISTASMVCIFLIFLAVFRSLRHLALGMLGVIGGFVVATAVCLLIYGKLYLLTIVCGSSVMGVSVDYTVHYFAVHLGAGEDWEPFGALKHILPGLWTGLITTLLGYAALLAAPFPGLRQIAVFSIVGLVASFLVVLFLLPDLLPKPMPPQPRFMKAQQWILERGLRLSQNRKAQIGLLVLALAAGLALLRLRSDDAVQSLILPSRSLQAQEAKIHQLTGFSNSGVFLLVEGESEGQVLAREEALRERLGTLPDHGYQAISAFVPSPEKQSAHLKAHQALAPHLPGAMSDVGFRPEVARQTLQRLQDSSARPLTVPAFMDTPFSVPFRMLWLGATSRGMASIVYPTGAADSRLLEKATQGLPGVTVVDKTRSVSNLMGHYRVIASWALLGAIVLVWIALVFVYRWRVGTLILLPSLGGLLLAAAGMALLGVPMTLFSTLALILVLGYGVDYPIFMRAGGRQDPTYFIGVQVASLCTLVSFGLLAFSHTPALQSFGLAVSLGVLASTVLSILALAPMEES